MVFKGCDTSVYVSMCLLATVVVVAYVAKCFYKKDVITIYYSITIRLIFNKVVAIIIYVPEPKIKSIT